MPPRSDLPMTEAQAGYLKRLSEEAGVAFDVGLTRNEASRRIDELLRARGRARIERDDPKPRRGMAIPEAADLGGRMTERQATYLRELTRDAGEEFDPTLTKDAARAKITELLTRRMSGSQPESSRR